MRSRTSGLATRIVRSGLVTCLVLLLVPALGCRRPTTRELARTTTFELAREHGRFVEVDRMDLFAITLGSGRDVLLLHGDQDPQMPINQSHELEGAYERQGLEVVFIVVHGAAHGGDAFYSAENVERVAAFLNAQLRRAGAAPRDRS